MTQTTRMHGTKNQAACFVAAHRLSERHPTVFGVSRWRRKPAISQTGKTSQEYL